MVKARSFYTFNFLGDLLEAMDNRDGWREIESEKSVQSARLDDHIYQPLHSGRIWHKVIF